MRHTLGAMAALWVLLFVGCDGETVYAQDEPEDVFESARLMVQNGEHERLHELMWTDDPRERAVFLRLGRCFGAVADLGVALNERFPDEVEKLEDGESAGDLLGAITRGRRGQRRGDVIQERLQKALPALLADPYAFLEASEGRLSTQTISDTRVAVMWDDEPVLAPFGLVMREEDGFWFVDPPLNNPLILRWRPQTDEEFAILGYLFDALTNAARDLAADVRSGEVRTLEGLASVAGEKVFVPAGMCFFAYSQAVEARNGGGDDEG